MNIVGKLKNLTYIVKKMKDGSFKAIKLDDLEKAYHYYPDEITEEEKLFVVGYRKLKHNVTNAFYCAGFDDEIKLSINEKHMTNLMREQISYIPEHYKIRLGVFTKEEIDNIITPAYYTLLELDDIFKRSKEEELKQNRKIEFNKLDCGGGNSELYEVIITNIFRRLFYGI